MNKRIAKLDSLRSAFLAVITAAAVVAAGCSGGTGGTGVSSSPALSVGVMAKGSVIVNGVRFDDTAANVTIDDTPKTATIDTRNGMVVKVAGSVNDDGITGAAQQVKALIEVRGTPTSVTQLTQSLTVLAQVVHVDDQTVYSGVPDLTGITTSTLIEVHGLRDANNEIRATRIETVQPQMGDNTTDELRGFVSGASGSNPTQFNLGSQVVNASAAVIVPAGATYQNGSVVEVYCSSRPCTPGNVFQASRLKVEDAQDAAFKPGSGQRFEVEGLISGFTTHPGSFNVGGTLVTTSSGTVFEGGISTDLANNANVEAEGSWNGTTLVATKIEFERTVVRVQGNVTAAGLTTFTMNVAGHSVNIEVDSFTSGVIPPVGLACVQVRGQRKVPATPVVVTAREINASCSSSGRPMMQAPVEAEVTGTSVTLLGFVLDISNPTDTPQYEDLNANPLTQTQFFNAVTPAGTNAAGFPGAGTLVKVTFNDPANTVRQVELED